MSSISSKGTTASHGRLAQRQVMLKAALSILAASALPMASAQDCFIDDFGREHCRLSTGARVGVAIAIIAVFIILIFVIGLTRRRRVQRANQAYIVAQQQQQAAPYGNPYQYGNAPYDPTYAGGAQYPPPPGQGYYGQQGPQGIYTPPQGPPPGLQQPPLYSGYNPPRSPPQAKV